MTGKSRLRSSNTSNVIGVTARGHYSPPPSIFQFSHLHFSRTFQMTTHSPLSRTFHTTTRAHSFLPSRLSLALRQELRASWGPGPAHLVQWLRSPRGTRGNPLRKQPHKAGGPRGTRPEPLPPGLERRPPRDRPVLPGDRHRSPPREAEWEGIAFPGRVAEQSPPCPRPGFREGHLRPMNVLGLWRLTL